MHRSARLATWGLVWLGLAVSGCGGGGGEVAADGEATGGGTPAPTAGESSVQSSLKALGFDTRITPRRDSDGNPYPQSYSPFGARFEMSEAADGTQVFGQPSELILAGFKLGNENEVVYAIDHLAHPSFTSPAPPAVLYRRNPVDVPWALESLARNAAPQTRRDAAAADLDGDGVQEAVFVYFDDGAVRLSIKDFDPAAPTDVTLVVPAQPSLFPVADLRLAAGDFDQDGRDELVVGISGGGAAEQPQLLVLGAGTGSGVTLIKQLNLPRTIAGSSVSVVLEAGSLDYDGSSELVVVVNELVGGSQSPSAATTNYYVFDDRASDFALRASGPVAGEIEGQVVTAVVAHAAIGDIDGDQAGEVLLAGLAQLNGDCETVEHLLVVIDDGVRGFRQKAATASALPVPDCDQAGPNLIRHAFVDTLDVDGDDDLEIQVNQFVFQDVPAPHQWEASPGSMRMGDRVLFPQGQDHVFDRSTAVMTVADVDGDGRDDIVSYRQGVFEPVDGSRFVNYLDVYGMSASGAFTRIGRIATDDVSGAGGINPIVVAIAADAEGQVLAYTNDHELAFTEALVHAALAAPPCAHGIGQSTDACTTTWGRFQSIGAEGERELKFEAGVAVGFRVQGGALTQTDAKSKVKLSTSASSIRSESYQLSKSTTFTSGPMEDSVVFSSVPMDMYTYRVVAHPEPSRIGTLVTLGLPRTPVIRMAERTYYNAHLPSGSPTIGADVFQHTPGSIDSYPDPVRRDEILGERRSQVQENRTDRMIGGRLAKLPVFDPLEAVTGLRSDSPGVGQGGGSTQVALELSRENGFGRALELGIEFETQTTVAGIVVDLNFGFAAGWTFKMTHGAGTSYEGSVGSIDGANYARQQYRFGLFTYLQADPQSGREFEVVNYWVERDAAAAAAATRRDRSPVTDFDRLRSLSL